MAEWAERAESPALPVLPPSAQTQTAPETTSHENQKNVKSFPSHKAHKAALISVSLALSQAPVYTARRRIYVASALRSLTVYIKAFAGTHCAYPRRNGQAELA